MIDTEAAERAAMQTYLDMYVMFRETLKRRNDMYIGIAHDETDTAILFHGYITGGKA